ncbi:hypothetical protein CBF90_14390 [Microbacterium sp. AISO3]|nr:hypothetical protein CBF90_17925 [Microbacterium sp. AISO3]OWP20903.1 hypothetical protein CBF90_14390 [Microbacterium sp. AISO3]
MFARYLMSVVPMANDIVGEGPDLGFMGGGWWRPERTHSKMNSRIMEHVSTLAWFYANERAWNREDAELYRSPALLTRLEAAIEYYTRLQLSDGSYPEYRGRSSLASTTFGMVAQADAFELLRDAGASRVSQQKLAASISRALEWFMDQTAEHWETPIRYFNQVGGGLVGAQRALQVLEHPAVTQGQIDERLSFLLENGVAPAGFPHEPYGMDFGYNFAVAMPDLAWLYLHTSHPGIVPMVQRYVDFMRYVVVPEPGVKVFSLVPAMNNRNVTSSLYRPADDLDDRAALAKTFLDAVPDIALLLPTREEKAKVRAEFRSSSDPIKPLIKPHTSPRTWMYGPLAPVGPTAAAREAREASLPVLVDSRFSKLANGSAGDIYLFVRRPSYYAAGVFGAHPSGLSTRQLGTLWSPVMGTVLVGTNDPDVPEGWETAGPDKTFSTRRSSSTSSYFEGLTSSAPAIDSSAVNDVSGFFSQRAEATPNAQDYAIRWKYWDGGLGFAFATQRSGECRQTLPLLVKEGDELRFSDGSVMHSGDAGREVNAHSLTLKRGQASMLVTFGPGDRRVFIRPSAAKIAGGVIHRVTVLFETSINIDISLLSGDPVPMRAEAHARSDGAVSVRCVVAATSRRSPDRIRFSGPGIASTTVALGAGMNEQVIERTLSAGSSAAKLTVEALGGSGTRLSQIVVPIVSRL